MAFKGKPKQVGPTAVPTKRPARTPFVWGSQPRSQKSPTPQRIKPGPSNLKDYGKDAAIPANPAGGSFGGPGFPEF